MMLVANAVVRVANEVDVDFAVLGRDGDELKPVNFRGAPQSSV